jgi:hypothetical protein
MSILAQLSLLKLTETTLSDTLRPKRLSEGSPALCSGCLGFEAGLSARSRGIHLRSEPTRESNFLSSIEFEIVPVVLSAETRQAIEPLL